MRDLFLGSLVALALFLAGFSAGRMQPEEPPQDPASEVEQLRAEVQRLTWELRQAEEELPGYPRQTSP